MATKKKRKTPAPRRTTASDLIWAQSSSALSSEIRKIEKLIEQLNHRRGRLLAIQSERDRRIVASEQVNSAWAVHCALLDSVELCIWDDEHEEPVPSAKRTDAEAMRLIREQHGHRLRKGVTYGEILLYNEVYHLSVS